MFFEVNDYVTLQAGIDELCVFLAQENVPSDCIFDSKLVAYELLGNVLKHADGKAILHGKIIEDFVELKICTHTLFEIPQNKTCPDVTAEHGRGLFLVNTVCEGRFYSDEDGIRVLIKMYK